MDIWITPKAEPVLLAYVGNKTVPGGRRGSYGNMLGRRRHLAAKTFVMEVINTTRRAGGKARLGEGRDRGQHKVNQRRRGRDSIKYNREPGPEVNGTPIRMRGKDIERDNGGNWREI